MTVDDVHHALLSLVRGDGVRRGTHDLNVEGRNCAPVFRSLLTAEGYSLTRVEDVDIRPGERVPAFFVEDERAHFGWIFWEVFFPGRMRKIFGSTVRNEKGDWKIVIGKGSRMQLYANLSLKESMDIDRPGEF